MLVIPGKSLIFKTAVFLIALLLSLLLFYIDYFIFSQEITFTLFYLLPILLVSWYAGRFYGFFLSIISIAEWSIIHVYKNAGILNIIFIINLILKLGVFFFVVYILSRLRKSLEIEKKLSRIDFLTGAANRKAFSEKLELELYRSNRNNASFALAYLDIDNFKSINDIFGHKTGDILLVNMAKIITKNIRKVDLLARMGGDEFILLFPDTNCDQSKIVIEKLKNKVRAMMKLNNWPCSVSVGVGIFHNAKYQAEYIISQVDELMYQIKNGAKDGIIYKTFG